MYYRYKFYSRAITGYQQIGFLRSKSLFDCLFTIKKVLEKYYYGKDIYVCFIDFRQTYDSIAQNKQWTAFE